MTMSLRSDWEGRFLVHSKQVFTLRKCPRRAAPAGRLLEDVVAVSLAADGDGAATFNGSVGVPADGWPDTNRERFSDDWPISGHGRPARDVRSSQANRSTNVPGRR